MSDLSTFFGDKKDQMKDLLILVAAISRGDISEAFSLPEKIIKVMLLS